MYKSLFIVLIYFISNNVITAQNNITLESITISDGLTNNTINDIFQDSNGFLWISTQEGLNRYDGYKLKTFRNDPSNPTGFAGLQIFDISEDKAGNLWVGTDLALNKYNEESETFTKYYFDSTSTVQFFNGIISVFEDSDGELWTGKVFHGLTKFDRTSKEFEVITMESDSSILPQYGIIGMFEDLKGYIWYFRMINNAPILWRINKERTKQKRFSFNPEYPDGLDSMNISSLIDSDGELWFLSYSGSLFNYNYENDQFIQYNMGKGVVLRDMTELDDGTFLITSLNKGLLIYDKKTGTKTFLDKNKTENKNLSEYQFARIYKDRTGIIWIGTITKGLYKYDLNRAPFVTMRVEGVDPNKQNIYGFEELPNGKLLVGTEHGLYEHDKITGETNKKKLPGLEENNLIRTLFIDSKENLWVSIWGKGLYKYNFKTKKTEMYSANIDDLSALSNNSVRDIHESSDNVIWIGTLDGLSRYNEDENNFTVYKKIDTTYSNEVYNYLAEIENKNLVVSIPKVKNDQTLSKSFTISEKGKFVVASAGELFFFDNKIRYDYGWIEDAQGKQVWIIDSLNSLHAGGAAKNKIDIEVLELEPGDYKLKYVADDSHAYGTWNAESPLYTNYWGIYLYNLDKDYENQFMADLKKRAIKNSVPGESIRSIYEASNGDMYVGTDDDGFAIYKSKENKFIQYDRTELIKRKVPSYKITSFLEIDNAIWLSTFGGILRFNPETTEFSFYDVNNGLSTNYINGLLSDEFNNLWASTPRGLSKLNYQDNVLSTINYTIEDGLQGHVYNQNAQIKTKDGELFFGGENGFNSIVPTKINMNTPEIVITDFKISNKTISTRDKILTQAITKTDSIVLNHDQNNLDFEFVAIHFSNSKRNKYAHMLEGIDEEWIYNDRKFCSYSSLDPGEYKLKIKTANSDGVWNKEARTLAITILPPWWQTTWAYVSYVFIFFLLVYTFDKTQKSRILKKEREKAKIQEAELRAVAAEAQSRAIQAENDRQSKELEEARKLQLSMLPNELPELPNIDIAVYMKTATEVGGDYYDFHVNVDGTLTAVIGDATGHGLNAGTMVTATKTLFSTHASNPDIISTFHELSRCIKQLQFRLLSMCLSIVKIKGNKVQFSSAGMPPLFFYNCEEDKIEENMLRGMPLGTYANFPYELNEFEMKKGDTILLLSDGFPELFNDKKEMLGYDKIKTVFEETAEKTPEEIISHFNFVSDKWANGEPTHDDITFVVLKMK